ncbi:Cysteine proteinase inhibitor 5 [Raphanus sativus]|uniref:Cysteine proteinase inhibitor 4-like n=1 Tax=Raphanus sativus TaxID=3726 RepID=A0A9W3CXB9_RAPSA|nr:cysteine proteinase inhibitor 4-like [Raphanus sativus]XP_056856132.1 cysteine proteinase inhibitor 4-like [Raphanus sativus]XP_056863900.1 cysteine proteinase inhibitor 4-like [Raphanus sativus]KAJ4868008.1 Cysteine proteinase inhibitor 5 [Raphanus sativus]KAJ4868336.1 Cysteine proteinase inhibitor 5 [Raphanus sativus]KAJ4900061.1 Cysteine proteinase inhibitor 5 [Raphanus sativus]
MIKYFICFSLILLPLVYNVEGLKIEPSPWKPIKNVTLGYYLEIGRFAINEHNKHTMDILAFENNVQGKEQYDNGLRYALIIATRNSDHIAHNYEAVVFERHVNQERVLESFNEISI